MCRPWILSAMVYQARFPSTIVVVSLAVVLLPSDCICEDLVASENP